MATTTHDSSASRRSDSQLFGELLSRARTGEREALGELLQWYINYLGILAATQLDRRLRQRVNPSDIVQEAMLAAHRDFADFRGSTQPELLCWLRTILIHVLHRNFERHLKVEKRDIRREISLDQLRGSVDESAGLLANLLPAKCESPSTPFQIRERSVELVNLLGQLKDDYREVIILRVLQGLTFEDIAIRMDRSNGAVRMLWLRALDALKAKHQPD